MKSSTTGIDLTVVDKDLTFGSRDWLTVDGEFHMDNGSQSTQNSSHFGCSTVLKMPSAQTPLSLSRLNNVEPLHLNKALKLLVNPYFQAV